MYAADIGDPIDGNIYGTHPIYIDTRYYTVGSDNSTTIVTGDDFDPSDDYVAYSHGLFNRNAHGQDILMNPTNVTWRTLGGSIDLYFYTGPTAKEVISSYQQSATGLPAMQQYWTLGYHQSRWGLNNWSQVEEVVDNFAKFGIPLETAWNDIDYMQNYRDFDNDPIRYNYSEGAKFLDKLHANNQHYVPIVDAAIYIPNANNDSDAYGPFTRGNATNSFLLNPDGSLYVGNVWPGFTAFPDFLSGSGGNAWWASEFEMWHANLSFDGIWLDMNEVSSFCVGSCGSLNISQNPVRPPFLLPGEPGAVPYGYPEGFDKINASEAASAASASSTQAAAAAAAAATASSTSTTSYLRTTPTPGVRNVNYPPYVINNDQGDLAVHAVSPNATHHNGVSEYDFHNLWGHTEINATYNALLNIFPGKRPFIIARSTFVGSGKQTGHWGGDNASQFFYMYFSIPQALEFAIFGIPMFGVDTCGFQQNTDEELCNRWMQLSAFFPFYRNHNDISSIDQYPYDWASVTEATKIAMAIRFKLMPYMYTLLQNAHESGSTVMRALAWEYPNDPSLRNADRQFFLGPAILVTPVLDQGATTVDGVFPGSGRGEIYYDWYNQTQVQAGRSENVTIAAPLGHIPVYVRGGYIVPMQQPAMTTTEGRQTPWSVLVPLNSTGKAVGSLYLDDGESITPPSTRTIQLAANSTSLSARSTGEYIDSNPLANVTVLGVSTAPSRVTFNGQTVASYTFNATSKVLVIQGLQNYTTSGAWVKQWKLKW